MLNYSPFYMTDTSHKSRRHCTMHKIQLQIKMHDKVLLKFCIYFSTQIYKGDSLTRVRGLCKSGTFHFSTPNDFNSFLTNFQYYILNLILAVTLQTKNTKNTVTENGDPNDLAVGREFLSSRK